MSSVRLQVATSCTASDTGFARPALTSPDQVHAVQRRRVKGGKCEGVLPQWCVALGQR